MQFSNELSVMLSQRSINVMEKFQELTGYDPLMHYDGYVFLASTESSHEQLKKDESMQRRLGVPVRSMGREELQVMYPFYNFDGVLGGNVCPTDGGASTMAVHQGYLSSAKRMGVEVNQDTEVTAIGRNGQGGFELKTTKGRVDADSLVIAAGAYSGAVGKLASAEIPVGPLPRKLLVTGSFSDGIPDRIPAMIDVDSTFAFGREGKGLVFTTNPPMPPSFELAFPPGYEEEVMRMAVEKVPATRECSLSHEVAGLYEMTPDANPIISQVPGQKGLFCCAGFAGHGFMHSPAVGELFAELFTKGKTSMDISAFDMSRFAEGSTEKEGRII